MTSGGAARRDKMNGSCRNCVIFKFESETRIFRLITVR